MIGGLVGGWLFSLIGIAAYGWIGEMITAIVGAVVVLWLFAKLRKIMGFTLITHFDDRGYRAINAALECVSNEKLCRVPYG